MTSVMKARVRNSVTVMKTSCEAQVLSLLYYEQCLRQSKS